MYFPKSQIKTNLHTNGGELFLTTTKESYKGYYFETSTGALFTGKSPSDLPNIQLSTTPQNEWTLTALTENRGTFQQPADNYDSLVFNNQQQSPESVNTYRKLNPENTTVLIPTYLSNPPSTQDYQIGEFRRYFCKKSNETIYIEINKSQYDLLISKNPDILWQLYLPFNLPWQLTGDIENVGKTNKKIVELTSQRLKLPKLGDYLNHNYIKYYK